MRFRNRYIIGIDFKALLIAVVGLPLNLEWKWSFKDFLIIGVFFG
jgi:hypothetical protein